MILEQIADLDAEHALVGAAIDSRFAAQLADVHGVRPEHFSIPPLARTFHAAVEIVADQPHEDRILQIAEWADVDPGWVDDLARAPRRSMADLSGAYARRVLASAERVAAYHRAVSTLTDLGIGVAA